MQLLCEIASGLVLPCRQVPHRMRAQLYEELSMPNPEFAKRRRLNLSTHFVPARLYFIEEKDGFIRLPRGAMTKLWELCFDNDVDLRFDDRTVLPAERLPELPMPRLRDYQRAAVDRFVEATLGLFVLPTGAGKTMTALGAIARLRTPALVLVGSRDLAVQWREQISSVLGIKADLIAGGVRQSSTRNAEPARVTVALAQALARWEPAHLDALLERQGLLVVDESHHVPATLFRSVVDRCPARYRLGLTATPDREDGLGPAVQLYLGWPLAKVTHAELAAAGHLMVPTVRVLETAFSYPFGGKTEWAPMMNALVADGPRNRLIVDAVAAQARAGQSCLVLSGRKDHCTVLAESLQVRGVGAAVLTSDVAKKRRIELLEEARQGRLPVLVATSLADEGLDLPILSRVFLTYPSKAQGRTIQRLGRILRPHPAKNDAVVIDVVDSRVGVLRRHAAERRRAYEQVLGVDAQRREAA